MIEKRISLRKSINEYCKSCIYDPLSGTGAWRQQVDACQMIKCALWAVRPTYTAKKDEDDTYP